LSRVTAEGRHGMPGLQRPIRPGYRIRPNGGQSGPMEIRLASKLASRTSRDVAGPRTPTLELRQMSCSLLDYP
jgi:hypothetical protein